MSIVVHVDRLPESGLNIEEEMPREWLDNIPEFSADEGTFLSRPIKINVLVTREVNNVRVKGGIKTVLHTFCNRCGEEMEWPLESEVDLIFMPGEPKPLLEEKGPPRDEPDELYYQGREIELDEYFREQVALDIPMTILCREDCKGLCAGCGANLNREQCTCKRDEGDPRLAVLRKLKIEDKERS